MIVAGCIGGSHTADTPLTAIDKETLAPAEAVTSRASDETCPLTLPNGRLMPGSEDGGMNHGNDRLWTAMWPSNVVIATPDYIEPDGSVVMKWGWWRGEPGKLRITGRRLDGDAPPLTAYLPDYGKRGFQSSAISFPTAGCWEVTATVGDAELTFVTLVLKASRYWP